MKKKFKTVMKKNQITPIFKNIKKKKNKNYKKFSCKK